MFYCGSARVNIRRWGIWNLSECLYEPKLTGPWGLWVIISHGVKPSLARLWVQQECAKSLCEIWRKWNLPPCMCFCPLSIITGPPYRVSGWFWTDRVCSPRTGGSRWCTQVPRSPTREERGAVLMCTGPLGALADEGLGCRRALKNVRGFWDKTKDTLGMLWPLTPARWPLCFVLWPEIGAYMWRDTGQLTANPKVSSGRSLLCKLLYTYAHVCPLYSGVIAVSIVHVVIRFPVLSTTSGANGHHCKNKGWRRVWMLSSCPNCE